MEIADKRPFIKTAIHDRESETIKIFRTNQTTGKLYEIKISFKIYYDYLKANRSKLILQKALLKKEVIDFIHDNKLKGEIR